MNSTAIKILYQGEDYSVVLLPEDELPSLVMNHKFIEKLVVALGLVDKDNPSLRPNIEAGSITKLRTALEPAITRYSHEYIEWLPNLAMSPESKDAYVELRDAFRALERFHGK
jgi:hypothetical protein